MQTAFLSDRLATLSFRALLALHVLFLASLLVTVGVADARAETVCRGQNILDALQRNDPQKLEAMRAEAAKIPNGQGILWKIEKAGAAPSFLFGTMHVTDSRVTELGNAAQAAFDRSKALVIETTDVLDEKALAAKIMARPELTMFTDATTLDSLLSEGDRAILDKGLEARGIPPASVAKMKPWMLATLLSLPECEMKRKAEGLSVLDVKLGEDAKKAGKQVLGLETAVSQLEAMASLPMSLHMAGLIQSLKLGKRIDDVTETMVALYERGETGMFWPLLRAEEPADAANEAGYAEFEEVMVKTRNRGMVKQAKPILDEGGAFIAIGAMHLPGEEGLVALFRKEGFTLSPVE
ncbi:MAG: TraB/GumN family protein [Methylobacterium mesophilicum]|nr:TraB/GumN family protein [Methylobacterium mesophilicum]